VPDELATALTHRPAQLDKHIPSRSAPATHLLVCAAAAATTLLLTPERCSATPVASGILVELMASKAYAIFYEYFRNKDQSASQQSLFFRSSANAWSGGAAIGFGREFVCNAYVGVKAFLCYNTAKVARDDKEPPRVIRFIQDEKEVTFSVTPYAMEAKPMYSYGGSVVLGYKALPNLLVYVSVGAEWNKTFVTQSFIGHHELNDVYNVMGFSHGIGLTKLIPVEDEEKQSPVVTLVDNGELRVSSVNIFPAVGIRYYIMKNVYVGAEISISPGRNIAVDSSLFQHSGTWVLSEKKDKEDEGEAEATKVKVAVIPLEKFHTDVFTKHFHLRGGICIGATF
jgi:hypothetical protein